MTDVPPTPWIDLDGVANMRDLAGLPTRDGGRIQPGRLIRSDNLQDLTAPDVVYLVEELAVSDVVDLRTRTEREAHGPGPLRQVASLTHHHHSLFAEHEQDFTTDDALAIPPDDLEPGGSPSEPTVGDYWASHYLGYLFGRPDSVSAALGVVARARGATIVHCAAGKDRTGTIVALALDVAGVPHEAIMGDYARTAERIAGIADRLSRSALYAQLMSEAALTDQIPRVDTMATILTTLDERYDGAAGYLAEHGWSRDDLTRLRDRLTR